MKRVIVLIMTGILLCSAYSQDFFKSLTEKFSDTEGFSASFITNDMFNLYLKKKQVANDSPVYDVLKNLDNILVVSQTGFDKEKNAEMEEIHNVIINHYKSGAGYTLFKTQKTIGEELKVYLKKTNETVSSLAVISGSSLSLNLIELNGKINMENLSLLGQELNLKGIENLYRINSSDAYPWGRDLYGLNRYYAERPDHEADELLRQNRLQMEGLKELSAEQRKKLEEQFRNQAMINTEIHEKMAEKYREMVEKYRRFPIFLSLPGDTNVVYYLDGKKVEASEIKKIDVNNIRSVSVLKSDEKNKKSTIKIETKK